MNGLEKIGRIKGIQELILTDGSRVINTRGTKNVDRKARALLCCSGNAGQISRSGYQYLFFERENRAHLFVFPVGTYTLGIIQEKGADSMVLAQQVAAVLKECDFNMN
ncbi:MAG TPA: hypothetical protein DHV36_03855 [Desulfobacteraceae bacterium]|nr:hypothetical protein [Desulfobacteraceae bacterium]|tara:strand:+ start:114 stop:437 length:324 start_codon:yes stop_codon:yes gene_type:complete